MSELNGLWIGKLGNANSWYHIYPFAKTAVTRKLFIVRHSAPYYVVPNSELTTYKAGNPISEFLQLYLKGRSIIRKEKIDYIITFNPFFWGLAAWLLARRFRIPISIGLIGKDHDVGLKKSKIKGLLKFVLRRADLITITGNAMRPFLKIIGIDNQRIIVFPHCVRDEWFENNHNPKIEYDAITVCELIERKRIDDIISATDILRNKGNKIKVCILGDGPLRSELENSVKEKKLEDYIKFPGYQKDVLSYLKRSRIYVQASRNEGLSISLIEAMALGLVPVTTIAGSEEDIIENGRNGILVQVGQPEEIAEGIAKLLDKNEYHKFKNEVLKSRNHFTMNNAIATSEDIINQLKTYKK